MTVRRLLHASGYRYRVQVKGLPGTPDLVFGRRRAVIFVHGCYWHRHIDCRRASTPKTRPEYWCAKFDKNVTRDLRDLSALTSLGWRSMIVWECELRDPQNVLERLHQFLTIAAPVTSKAA